MADAPDFGGARELVNSPKLAAALAAGERWIHEDAYLALQVEAEVELGDVIRAGDQWFTPARAAPGLKAVRASE